MRTTLTLDDDVKALIESERTRTGESLRATVNRLLRRGARPTSQKVRPELPKLSGAPVLDVSDISAVLSALEDERQIERDLP